jgi:phosphomethylpyrimidine synthase
MTQMETARRGETTPEMEEVSRREGISLETLRRRIARGRVVLPRNVERGEVIPTGIGRGLRVKVNANIGTSVDFPDPEVEVEKARGAMAYGADTLMDLSTGGPIDEIRSRILEIPLPLGTVPIYQAWIEAGRKGNPMDLREEDLFRVIERHARDGVDFMTLHVGMTRAALEGIRKGDRVTGIVSRGGSLLASWMFHNERENPLYENYEDLLELAREYDVTFSLGDALRPGCIEDATDRFQLRELVQLGALVEEAREKGVQCMVEGPGHIPLHEIRANVLLEKKLCGGAPFYVLGPLVTDIAPGYDHITAAIGGAVAAMAGADFLCYVTPAEHLALPSLEDVRQGVIASRIAAHAADLTRGIDLEKDREMAEARVALDWERQFRLALDPERAREVREKRQPKNPEVCTMCGDYCAMKIAGEHLPGGKKAKRQG